MTNPRTQNVLDTKGLPLHTIIAKQLLKREDWIRAGGAVYPKNRDWWLPLPGGAWKYVGPVMKTFAEIRKSSSRG